MIKRIKKWWKTQKDITRKVAGLAEKEAAMERKYEVAMSILNKRKIDLPVAIERRKKKDFELKHA